MATAVTVVIAKKTRRNGVEAVTDGKKRKAVAETEGGVGRLTSLTAASLS